MAFFCLTLFRIWLPAVAATSLRGPSRFCRFRVPAPIMVAGPVEPHAWTRALRTRTICAAGSGPVDGLYRTSVACLSRTYYLTPFSAVKDLLFWFTTTIPLFRYFFLRARQARRTPPPCYAWDDTTPRRRRRDGKDIPWCRSLRRATIPISQNHSRDAFLAAGSAFAGLALLPGLTTRAPRPVRGSHDMRCLADGQRRAP